jgi:hypothetical protein
MESPSFDDKKEDVNRPIHPVFLDFSLFFRLEQIFTVPLYGFFKSLTETYHRGKSYQ